MGVRPSVRGCCWGRVGDSELNHLTGPHLFPSDCGLLAFWPTGLGGGVGVCRVGGEGH